MKKLVFANIWFCCVGFIIFECNNNNNTIINANNNSNTENNRVSLK